MPEYHTFAGFAGVDIFGAEDGVAVELRDAVAVEGEDWDWPEICVGKPVVACDSVGFV